jgi:seryl-tRNA synthetase
MVAWNGLEKFSHLEDKIYRTIELTKTLRQEKEELERQLAKNKGGSGGDEELAAEVQRLQAERDLVRAKVEKILDAIAAIDPEIAEAARS